MKEKKSDLRKRFAAYRWCVLRTENITKEYCYSLNDCKECMIVKEYVKKLEERKK